MNDAPPTQEPSAVPDPVAEMRRVLALEGRAVLACADRLGGDAGSGAARALRLMQDALDRGGKIVVTGVGKSGKVAQKIAATLCSTGSLAVFLHPTEGLHGDLGVVTRRDAVLVLSYTGNTEEILRLLPSLKARAVPVIGLGGNAQSRLAEACDAWVDGFVEQEACPHNLAPSASTTLALALGDALALSLMRLRGFEPGDFAENHPGGALGKRLKLQVSDLMHSGENTATVGAGASMEEVVGELTRKKLGAVLVVEGVRLLGVITDGDLRRALGRREKFFEMKAQDVMTREPVVVLPTLAARKALAVMEDRPSQISVLPVVDEEGRWQGLLRLHDLVREF